ncbi:tail fiber protein [Conexibacter sp. JD483]|uniref:phage tail protein n=1 Tax=unclassified Conexibacter TaxID=2627773 RepID=UPI0027253659|nr:MULTISPECIES: tail fiber protein [unclassified Conexibacter]MDO8186375.1 tail fiber protein [Conexibacter sp. CPCC 205706]MDO8199774.1 tail fiber protein [Conexibacter sp. CPCC 205762]MDR9371133.1 tail fiber protein [Conexibacter sp. JD483]
MGTPFLGEIRPMSFNFPPRGWAQCDGQLLPINQNQPLFSLLGTTYGGNGQTTFALPNLRGRLPVGWGGGNALGEIGGSEAVTLNPSQIPAHMHTLFASKVAGNDAFPGIFASAANLYTGPTNLTPVGTTPTRPPPTISPAGSAAHSNVMPFSVLNFCIALQGIFPSRN